MENKLITLAIHSSKKAHILRQALEENDIEAYLVNVNNQSDSIAVRVRQEDLAKAITVIEGNRLFRYDDEQTYKIDDGRKRILVAIDFSEYSIKACQTAFGIAKKLNAKVKLLHVYKIKLPITFPFADSMKEENDPGMLDRARKQMLDFCYEVERKIIDKEFPSVNYSYSLREGVVEEEIENFVEEYKPFLLVVGTKGRSNKKNNALGNVTADIIEMTNVPVIAVPENSTLKYDEDVKHIAFLTNFQKRDMESFDSLVNILKPYPGVKITLVHINAINKKGDKWSQSELSELQDYFNKKYPEFNVSYKLLDKPDMMEAMDEFVNENKVNVIVLNTRRRNLFGRIFQPSLSRKVLTKSDITLVVFRGSPLI